MTVSFRLIAASYISTDPRSGYGADTSSYESFRSVRPFQLSVMSEVLNKRTARAVAVCRSPASAPRWSGVANAGPTRSRRRQISPTNTQSSIYACLETRRAQYESAVKRRNSNIYSRHKAPCIKCSGEEKLLGQRLQR